MIQINWKGKIGYGDIVSPLCYAHVISRKNDCDVELNMHWEHERGEKFKDNDIETIDSRMEYLYQIVKPVKRYVTLNHRFNEKINYNHSNYDDSDKFHNVWYMEEKWKQGDYIVLNTTEKNHQQFEDYEPRKVWKDPIGAEGFFEIDKTLSKRYNIIKVDYSMKTEDVINLYKNCYAAVGYHGSTMWLAKYVGCPMVIFSGKRNLTQFSFPWSVVLNDLKHFSLEDNVQGSKIKMELLKDEYRKYIQTKNIHRLRSQRT